MKLHGPSFLLGLGVTILAGATRQRLRPVAVEIAALGLHLGTLCVAIASRYLEDAEDLWAEIDARARVKRSAPEAADRVTPPASAAVEA